MVLKWLEEDHEVTSLTWLKTRILSSEDKKPYRKEAVYEDTIGFHGFHGGNAWDDYSGESFKESCVVPT